MICSVHCQTSHCRSEGDRVRHFELRHLRVIRHFLKRRNLYQDKPAEFWRMLHRHRGVSAQTALVQLERMLLLAYLGYVYDSQRQSYRCCTCIPLPVGTEHVTVFASSRINTTTRCASRHNDQDGVGRKCLSFVYR